MCEIRDAKERHNRNERSEGPTKEAREGPVRSRGGQAKICGRYADLVGTKSAGLQIFSMVLQIFPKEKFGSFLEKVPQNWIVFHSFT